MCAGEVPARAAVLPAAGGPGRREGALNEVLARIITGSDAAKNVNKNNAQHAIVFEAIALALALEADPGPAHCW